MTKNPAIVPSRKPCAFPVSWSVHVMGCVQTSLPFGQTRLVARIPVDASKSCDGREGVGADLCGHSFPGFTRCYSRVSLAQITSTLQFHDSIISHSTTTNKNNGRNATVTPTSTCHLWRRHLAHRASTRGALIIFGVSQYLPVYVGPVSPATPCSFL